jgi:hypothetical protein
MQNASLFKVDLNLNSGFKVNTSDMSQYLTSCQMLQKSQKHTSLLNGELLAI